jgi:hypothetical protein
MIYSKLITFEYSATNLRASVHRMLSVNSLDSNYDNFL